MTIAQDNETFLAHWYHALRSPHGLALKALAGDLTTLKALLYRARAQHYTIELAGMEVRTSPLSPSDTLWLGKKGFMDSPHSAASAGEP